MLASVVCRGFLEQASKEAWAVDFRNTMLVWLPRAGLTDELEPWELSVLKCPLGKLGDRDRSDSTGNSEGMAVLSWSLGKTDLPRHDAAVDPKVVANGLGLMADDAAARISSATLRPRKEVEAMSKRLFAAHWRLRDFSLNRTETDFKAVGKNPWMGMKGISQLPLIDGDLEINGKPLSKTEEPEWRNCQGIAMERHRAVNWLLGFDPVYSKVDTST